MLRNTSQSNIWSEISNTRNISRQVRRSILEDRQRKIHSHNNSKSTVEHFSYFLESLTETYFKRNNFYYEYFDVCRRIVKDNPDSPEAWKGLGKYLSKIGAHQQSLKAYDFATRLERQTINQ